MAGEKEDKRGIEGIVAVQDMVEGGEKEAKSSGSGDRCERSQVVTGEEEGGGDELQVQQAGSFWLQRVREMEEEWEVAEHLSRGIKALEKASGSESSDSPWAEDVDGDLEDWVVWSDPKLKRGREEEKGRRKGAGGNDFWQKTKGEQGGEGTMRRRWRSFEGRGKGQSQARDGDEGERGKLGRRGQRSGAAGELNSGNGHRRAD